MSPLQAAPEWGACEPFTQKNAASNLERFKLIPPYSQPLAPNRDKFKKLDPGRAWRSHLV